MRKHVVCIIATFLLASPATFAAIQIAGAIFDDAEWSGDVIVRQSAEVMPNTKIVVKEGTILTFNPGTHLTISGELVAIGSESSLIQFRGVEGQNLWNGVRFADDSTDAVFDGENYLSGSTLQYCIFNGGAIGIENASPFISDCLVQNSHHMRKTSRRRSIRGGGIRIVGGRGNDTSPVIKNCTVRNCSASSGGIYIEKPSEGFTLSDITIENCSSSGVGSSGGINVVDAKHIRLSRVTVRRCRNGGLKLWRSYDVVIQDCVFTENFTTGSGSAIFGQAVKNIQILGCSMIDGIAESGGAIASASGYGFVIRNCLIAGNQGSGVLLEAPAEIKFNSFINNSPYHLHYFGRNVDVLVSDNWWGSTDKLVVQEKIWDRYKDPRSRAGRVIFSPMLAAPHANTPTLSAQPTEEYHTVIAKVTIDDKVYETPSKVSFRSGAQVKIEWASDLDNPRYRVALLEGKISPKQLLNERIWKSETTDTQWTMPKFNRLGVYSFCLQAFDGEHVAPPAILTLKARLPFYRQFRFQAGIGFILLLAVVSILRKHRHQIRTTLTEFFQSL